MNTRHPPGPKSKSPLGIAPQFPRDPIRFVTRLQREYGDVVAMLGPLYRRHFLLNDPDLIEQVLVKQADKFQKPEIIKKIVQPIFGNGLFLSEGDFWRRQRKLIQPAFHHRQIETYAADMVRFAQEMLASWQEGEQRYINRDMHAVTLQILVSSIFDIDLSLETEEIRAAMNDLGESLSEQAFNPLKAILPDWLPLPFLIRKRRSVARLDKIIYRIIRERRQSPQDNSDLISVLLAAEDEETGERMTDLQLHDEVMTLFIAGHGTTALTLSWAWSLLAQTPEVDHKLRLELKSVLGDRPPGLDDLPRLTYTKAIIKEVLRLYPPAWMSLRQARVDMELGGYDVRKGEIIWLTPYVIQRDPRYFDRPEQFWPDRFLPDQNEQPLEKRIPRFAYYPFGGGSRICLGNGYAMMEACLVLATIAQKYRLQLDPNQQVQMKVRTTLDFESEVPMQLVAR